jgi:hypothetical protein
VLPVFGFADAGVAFGGVPPGGGKIGVLAGPLRAGGLGPMMLLAGQGRRHRWAVLRGSAAIHCDEAKVNRSCGLPRAAPRRMLAA